MIDLRSNSPLIFLCDIPVVCSGVFICLFLVKGSRLEV